jgi:hypothetical protein
MDNLEQSHVRVLTGRAGGRTRQGVLHLEARPHRDFCVWGRTRATRLKLLLRRYPVGQELIYLGCPARVEGG